MRHFQPSSDWSKPTACLAARQLLRQIIVADISKPSLNRIRLETLPTKTVSHLPLETIAGVDSLSTEIKFAHSRKFNADEIREEIAASIIELCGAGQIGEGLWRAARLTGLTQSQCKRLRYLEWLTVPAHVADAVRHALAENRDMQERRQANEAKIQAILTAHDRLQSTAYAMAHADPDFYSAEIDFVSDLVGGLDSAVGETEEE